ncbi:MAG: DNA-binding transcriptional regulator [Phycisphaerae bacterium]|nr:DNA-binding transcriptional regulator [Phycisphaerae bacterium]
MEVTKTVLLDMPLDHLFGRQISIGAYRYARSNREWAFIRTSQDGTISSRFMKYPDTAGIISMRRPEEYLPVARRYGLAAVGVGIWSPEYKGKGLAYVDVDPKATGEMAADYFINRGFRSFGMFSEGAAFQSPSRGDTFVAALRRRKFTCDVFDDKKQYPPTGKPLSSVSAVSEQMHQWLSGLPKPLAVFCINDDVGFWVCEMCRRAGIHVPEEVAILGADNDVMFCEMAQPHLSSIRIPAEQVGYEAAKLLDAVISGHKAPRRPILLPPMGVETRQSTDIMAIDDRRVADAVQFIRKNAHKGIRVEEVVEHASLPRRMLERRFRKAVGRSPFAEIRRVQIEDVKTLLAHTDETLESIAPECGFDSIKRLGPAFKKAVGMTLGAYRRRFRTL